MENFIQRGDKIKKIILSLILLSVFILSLTTISASELELDDNSVSIQNDNEVSITSDNTHTLTDNQDLTSEEESDSEDTSQEDGPDIAIYSSNKKTDTESTHLEVDNDADKEKVKVGEYLTWTYEAKNYGPNLAKNVKVHIKLSEGLKFIKYSATKGTFNPKTGIWTIGDLEVGEKPILKIITQALTAGEKFTTANLTSDTNSTTPDECYEEEEIEVYDDTVKAYTQKVSNDSYQTGNPIGLLILSILAILATGIGRIL